MSTRKQRIKFLAGRLLIVIFGAGLCPLFFVKDIRADSPISNLSNSPANNTPVAQSKTVKKTIHHVMPPMSAQSRRVSFDFQDIGVRDLLQLVARQTGQNFIISGSVKGSIGFSLKNVTWKQALDAIIRSQNLDSRQFDNVLMIAPVDELAAEDAKRFEAQRQLASFSPPLSELIPLKYANAVDLAKVLKSQESSLLSPTGSLGVDPRTNAIWIRDNKFSLAKEKRFIKRLDVPAKQVMLEARIVSVDKKYAQEIGVKWGLSNTKNLSGTLAGANSIKGGTAPVDVSVDQRLNFNLPAKSTGVFGATPASAGLALLQLGSVYLDLELSALEGEQHAEVISNPRIITSNLQKAYIQTGEEIPYQESTSSGATSVSFKDAVLGLEITPQITRSNSVVLNLKVTQNSRGTSVSTGSGGTIPSIDTEALLSSVQLKSGQTIVIGGVYKKTKNNNVERVPFLSKIPLIGGLFRHKHVDLDKSELLIFITPKIVNSSNIEALTPTQENLNQLSLAVSKGFSFPKSKPKLTLPEPKQVKKSS